MRSIFLLENAYDHVRHTGCLQLYINPCPSCNGGTVSLSHIRSEILMRIMNDISSWMTPTSNRTPLLDSSSSQQCFLPTSRNTSLPMMSLTQGSLAPPIRGFPSLFAAVLREVSLTRILYSAFILVSLESVGGRCRLSRSIVYRLCIVSCRLQCLFPPSLQVSRPATCSGMPSTIYPCCFEGEALPLGQKAPRLLRLRSCAHLPGRTFFH